MSRCLSFVFLVVAATLIAVALAYGQTPTSPLVLVRYTGMSWAGGGVPVPMPGMAVSRQSPPCQLTASEQKTLTCANLYVINPLTDTGVDGVNVHLTGDGISSDGFQSINGGLVQMRVKQGKRYTVKIDQPSGYILLSDTVTKYGLPFTAGSLTLGPKTSDLLILQLYPK